MLNYIVKKDFIKEIFLVSLLIIFMLFLLFMSTHPENEYPYNFDESMELVTVNLFNENYSFYEEIWTDHPLGFPFFLHLYAKFFALNLPSARRIIIGFSVLIIAAFYGLLRLQCGKIASLLATCLLITSFQYIPLSIIVKKEIPALAVILISIIFLYQGIKTSNKYRYLLYCISALFLVISLEFKLLAITIIPSFVALIMLDSKKLKTKIFDLIISCCFSLILIILLSITILPFSLENLIGSHANANSAFSNDNSLTLLSLIKTAIKYDTIYFIFVNISIIVIIVSKNRQKIIFPLMWLFFNLVRFSLMSPVWPNYYIELTIPSIWIIGIFLDELKLMELIQKFKKKNYQPFQLLLKGMIIILLGGQFMWNSLMILKIKNPYLSAYSWMYNDSKEHPVEPLLKKYQNSDKIILTDNPYMIHKFKLKTPPETAILSRKRVLTENLDGDFIYAIILKRNPDFVFLYRFPDRFLKSKKLSNLLNDKFVEFPVENAKGKMFISKVEYNLLKDSP